MTTYSVRCKHHACRHRRVARIHPDDYKVVPRCPVCGSTRGWRIENRDYNKRGLCHCSGPDMERGVHFPHRTTHPLCEQHPAGERNQALRRGARPDELPLELMGEPMGKDDECPF